MIGTKKQKMQEYAKNVNILFHDKQKCILVNFARFYEEKYDGQWLINIDFTNLLILMNFVTTISMRMVTYIHSILVLFDSSFLMICMTKVVTDSFVPA